ncbi:glycosyltransferase [Croceivirga radicis]|uniref:glycosyltransferase n=1 Tax=Croceivirga radicis TaxID=1929488 RepID=UPI000255B0E7|nr:glycosyltransferase [Croceivirga radicis]
MRFAIVTAYPPSKVTLTEYAYYLVKHFRMQHRVEELILLCDKTAGEKDLDFTEDGCKITVKECWRFNDYGNLFSITNAIRSTKPDAVLYNLQFMKFGDKKVPAALGLLLPFITKVSGVPTVSLLHNIMETVDLKDAGFTNNRLLAAIYNFIGSTLTRFVLASDEVAVTISMYVKTLKAKYKKDNIKLIPHGTFELPPQPNYTLPKGPKQVMAFGKFGTYKKVEVMIEAVEQIRKRTQEDIEIVIAGTDSPNTPGYLAAVAKKYEHVPQLRFTGYVPEEDVQRIFQESAVAVFPYTSTTGSSGVLHQAGSYGKAVVLPDLGDLGILVREEGYTGEFFEADNSDSLANAIEKILVNDAYRVELGQTNYQAATSLPMSKITSMYLDLFEAIAKRRGKIRKEKIEEKTEKILA